MRWIGDGGHAAVLRDLVAAQGFFHDEDAVVIAVGDNRGRMTEVLANPGCKFPRLIHPGAWVSPGAFIGDGSVVMAGAVVQARVVVGRFCIINTGATVDHDCVLYDYVHVAPGAHLCGNVRVGEGALVGVGVGVAPGAEIPAWSLVKARRLEVGRA